MSITRDQTRSRVLRRFHATVSTQDHLKNLKDMAHFFSGGLLFNDQPQNTTTVPTAQSKDPNGKLTSGFGDQGFVPPNTPIIYTIYFENQPTATAPAEEVVVSDPLPSNLDWSTVQLSQIQFNNVTINVPAGLQAYVGQVSVSTDPNPVSVNAALNTDTGVLSWTMQSVDPTTGGLPANPLAGFLPPNNSSNLGTGYVTFSVMPKSGLANGATISNQGSIVFDANSSISTNTVTNTIDSVYPTSSVNTLPATTTAASFPVSWSGTDSGGSGIANYDIYVSVSSGAYTLWLPATTLTSGTYPGAAGQTYSFYSMATDNIGLRQQATGAVQTITVSQVSSKTTPTVTVSPASSSITMTQALSVTVAVNGGSGNPVATGSLTLTSGAYTSAAAALSNGSATIIVLAGALALGSNALTANYTPDSNSSSTYNSASGTSFECHGRKGDTDGNRDAVLVQHHDSTSAVGDDCCQQYTDSHRHGDAEQRQLHLCGYSPERWWSDDQHSCWFPGSRRRDPDRELHTGQLECLHLQQCFGNNLGDRDRACEDHAHGDGDAVLVQHQRSAVSHGNGGGERRHRQPDIDRNSDAEQWQLHIRGHNTDEWQRDHHHSCRFSGSGWRHADSQLHG
jgi:hypothetical protein